MKTTEVDDETMQLAKILRHMAEDVERRGVVADSLRGSGDNEVIELPHDVAKGYVEHRLGPKCYRSFSWSWADVEPAKDGETSKYTGAR